MNVCIPSKFICWGPNPNVSALIDTAYEKVTKIKYSHKGESLI